MFGNAFLRAIFLSVNFENKIFYKNAFFLFQNVFFGGYFHNLYYLWKYCWEFTFTSKRCDASRKFGNPKKNPQTVSARLNPFYSLGGQLEYLLADVFSDC